MNDTGEKPLVLFDGVCNLCNASVQFILKRDRRAWFRFASLQSDAGQQVLREQGLATDELDTMILVEDRAVYTRSTAALRIVRRLGGLWPLLYAFIVVPRVIRDFFYRIVAKNRYRWFGRRDQCMVPNEEIRSRFVG